MNSSLVLTPYGNVKKHWLCEHKGRTFVVSQSSFGWHVDELVNGEFKHTAFPGEILFDSKRDVLQAIVILV